MKYLKKNVVIRFFYGNIDLFKTCCACLCQKPWCIEIIFWSWNSYVQFCSRDICWQEGSKKLSPWTDQTLSYKSWFLLKIIVLHSCLGWSKKWRHKVGCQLANMIFKTKCEGYVTNWGFFLCVDFYLAYFEHCYDLAEFKKKIMGRARLRILNASFNGTSWLVFLLKHLDRQDP